MNKSISIYLTALILMLSACGKITSEDTGTITHGDYRYRGELREGKYNGYGVLTLKDSIVYSGQWKDGKRHGYGTAKDSAGHNVTGLGNADTLITVAI